VYAKIEELNIKMDTKFGQLDTKFGQLETKFGQLDTKIGHLETKFGQLETNMTAGFEKLSRAISRLAGKKSRRVSSPPKK
jgi:DNA anti-recombination protein RmuC